MFEPIRLGYCFVATAAIVVNAILNPAVFAQPSITAIDRLPGASATNPSAISADGSSVTGYSYSFVSETDKTTTFLWTKTGGTQDIGSPLSSGDYSNGTGISGDGSVIVGNGAISENPLVYGANRWTAEGDFQDLGSLVGDGCTIASAISNDGSVIVDYSWVD